MTINTAFGTKSIIRRVGEYYFEAPTSNAPHGGWWTLNAQKGWVPFPSNGRALIDTLARAIDSETF